MRKLNSVNLENEKKLNECGLTYAMMLLEGRWKLNVLWAIHYGFNRYSQIKEQIGIISEKMLTQRLKELVSAGLIDRNDFRTVPPHVEYELTEEAKKLIPILEAMRDWGKDVRSNTKNPILDFEVTE